MGRKVRCNKLICLQQTHKRVMIICRLSNTGSKHPVSDASFCCSSLSVLSINVHAATSKVDFSLPGRGGDTQSHWTTKTKSTCCCHRQDRLWSRMIWLLSTLRFRLTFISYANPARRKTIVTSFNVQPSSFVSLLLCQSLWRGVFLSFPLCLATLLYQVGGKIATIIS